MSSVGLKHDTQHAAVDVKRRSVFALAYHNFKEDLVGLAAIDLRACTVEVIGQGKYRHLFYICGRGPSIMVQDRTTSS